LREGAVRTRLASIKNGRVAPHKHVAWFALSDSEDIRDWVFLPFGTARIPIRYTCASDPWVSKRAFDAIGANGISAI